MRCSCLHLFFAPLSCVSRAKKGSSQAAELAADASTELYFFRGRPEDAPALQVHQVPPEALHWCLQALSDGSLPSQSQLPPVVIELEMRKPCTGCCEEVSVLLDLCGCKKLLLCPECTIRWMHSLAPAKQWPHCHDCSRASGPSQSAWIPFETSLP